LLNLCKEKIKVVEGMELMELETQNEKKENLQLGVSGLGGWLILIQIGLYVTILMTLNQIIRYDLDIFTSEVWEMLTSEGSELYDPLWKPTILFESIYHVASVVFSIYILIQFYRKKSIVPRLIIILYSASVVIGIIDYILLQQIAVAQEFEDEGSLRDVVRSVITSVVWISYLLKSERVKNTFIR